MTQLTKWASSCSVLFLSLRLRVSLVVLAIRLALSFHFDTHTHTDSDRQKWTKAEEKVGDLPVNDLGEVEPVLYVLVESTFSPCWPKGLLQTELDCC